MSVLVDTSVWVRAFLGRGPYGEQLRALLEAEDAVAHDLIYGELLIGDKGGARQRLLTEYHLIPQCPVATHDEVVHFVRHHRLHGSGLSWVDAHLLVSALIGRCKLWTADGPLEEVAAKLGLRYVPVLPIAER